MNFKAAVECCLFSDSAIIEGEYTVVLTNNNSGPLNSGILLFSTADLDRRVFEKIEYRLASVLMMLFDTVTLRQLPASDVNVPVNVSRDEIENRLSYRKELVSALESRGVSHSSASDLLDDH